LYEVLRSLCDGAWDRSEGDYQLSSDIIMPAKSIKRSEFHPRRYLAFANFYIAIHEHFAIFDDRGLLLIMDVRTQEMTLICEGTFKQGALVKGGSSVLLLCNKGFYLFRSQDYLRERASVELEPKLPDTKEFLRLIDLPAKSGIPILFSVGRVKNVGTSESDPGEHVAFVTKERLGLKVLSSFAIRSFIVSGSLNITFTNNVIRLDDRPLDVIVLTNGFAVLGKADITIIDDSVERTHIGTLQKSPLFRPLAILRANKRTLLVCYQDGGDYLNSDGSQIDDPQHRIIWELFWEKVAFVPPFVFGFGDDSVEVRNVYTGALVQILKMESKIRCLSNPIEVRDERAEFYQKWDGGGEEEGHKLSQWGPFALDWNNTIVQLTPRSYLDSLDPRLFDIEFQFTPS